jgi:hypothetical protein
MIGTPYVPANPYTAALGVVAIAVAVLGIVLIFVGASRDNDEFFEDGTVGVVQITAGSGLITFGALSALLWLTTQAIRWQPPAD